MHERSVSHSNSIRLHWMHASCAVLVGGTSGDGAWRGLVAIVELIDPRPYMFQSAVYAD